MTPVERAARALVIELARQDFCPITPEQVHFEDGLELEYIDQTSVDMGGLVRAVLQAIRIPPPEMVEPGAEVVRGETYNDHMRDDVDEPDRVLAHNVWLTMIDAALSE